MYMCVCEYNVRRDLCGRRLPPVQADADGEAGPRDSGNACPVSIPGQMDVTNV